jgi:hypothetical protein
MAGVLAVVCVDNSNEKQKEYAKTMKYEELQIETSYREKNADNSSIDGRSSRFV